MAGSRRRCARALVVLLLIVLLVLVALVLAGPAAAAVVGGAARRRPPRCEAAARSAHIVVDGLNATHTLYPREPVTVASIVKMVDTLSPPLKLRHPGRVMFVVKDRDSEAASAATADAYADAARRNGVYLVTAERYRDSALGASHAARGRDDFTCALLASRWNCAVLTADRMEDFDSFRAEIGPYYTWEYAYWRARPDRDYIDPRSPAYARLPRPCRGRYDTYGVPAPPTEKVQRAGA